MADSTRIEELLSAKSIKDFDELKLRVDASVASVEQLTLKAVQLNTALGSVKSPKDFNSTIKEIEQAEKSLLESTRKLAVEQGKLNNATNLQNQKKEINDLIIKNKELTNQLKEQQLAKQQQAASEKAASAQRKADLQNEKIANEERIALIKAQQDETDKLKQKQDQLNRAEEDRLSNNAFTNTSTGNQNTKVDNSAKRSFLPANELELQAQLLQKNQTALKGLQNQQKIYDAALKDGNITRAKYDELTNQAIIRTQEYKASIAATTAELKNAIKADFANPNSVDAAKAANASLTRQRDSVDVEDVQRIKELNDQIDRNNELIDANSDKLAKQKINIGNYPNLFTKAFDTLGTELTKVNAQIGSGNFKGKELDALIVKQTALRNATALVSKQFESAGQQSKAYKDAATQIGQAYGTSSKTFKDFAKQVGEGSNQVKDLTNKVEGATTGSSKLASGFGKVFSGLRNIANIVPGLGLSGVILLLITPLASLATALYKAATASKDAKDNTAALKKEYEDTARIIGQSESEFSKAVVTVETLKENIKLAKEGFIDSDKVVNEYNDTIGKTTGSVKDLNQAELELTKNADNYIKVMLYKAAANLALEDAAKKAFEAEQTRRKKEEEFASLTDISNISSGGSGLGGGTFNAREFDRQEKEKQKARQKRRETEAKQSEKDRDDLIAIANKFQADAAKISKENRFDFFGGEQSVKNSEKLKAITKKFFGDQLKDQADALKEISKNQDFYLNDRLSKRKEAFAIESSLLKQQTDIEIQNEKDKLKAAIDAENGKKGGGSQNARINAQNEFNEKIKEINQKSAYDLEKIETSLNADLSQIRNSFNAKRREQDAKENADAIDILKKQADERKKIREQEATDRLDRSLTNIDSSKDVQLTIINDRANARIRSAKGNAEEIARIEKQAANDSLLAVMDAEKQKLLVLLDSQRERLKIAQNENNQAEVDKLLAKIAELRRQLSELNTKSLKLKVETDTTDIDKFISLLDKIREKVGQVFDIIGGAINASVISQKNALQDQADQVERSSQQEIDAINASADTEEKKAARVQIVNAQTQAQKEVLAQRQRQLDQRNAEIEKARTIAGIILDTAGAVAKQIKATPLPLGLPFVAAVAALGAAQLAVAIATPVPRFKDGTMNAPGGLSIVGDGGRKELVVTPQGKMIETPSVPTLMNLEKHSIVFPDSRKLMESGIGRRELLAMRGNSENLGYVFRGEISKLGRIIKDKTETHFHQKGGNWEKIKKSGGNTTRYIS